MVCTKVSQHQPHVLICSGTHFFMFLCDLLVSIFLFMYFWNFLVWFLLKNGGFEVGFFFFLVEGGMELTHSNTSTHVSDQLGYIWGRFEVVFAFDDILWFESACFALVDLKWQFVWSGLVYSVLNWVPWLGLQFFLFSSHYVLFNFFFTCWEMEDHHHRHQSPMASGVGWWMFESLIFIWEWLYHWSWKGQFLFLESSYLCEQIESQFLLG